MNAIYSSRPVAPSPRRRWTMVTTSAILHGGLATVVLFAGVSTNTSPIARDDDGPLRFVNFVPPPEPPPPVRQPVRLPPPKELARVEVPAPVPVLEEVLPPEPVEEARAELLPPAPEPPPPAPIVQPVVERAKPVVQVGGFAAATAVTQAPIARTVEQAGFDRSDDRPSERARAGAVVGAFDSAAAARTAPATGKAIGVTDAGFGTGAAASPGNAARGRVVAAAGFDAVAAPPAAAKAQVQARIEIPVEILSKPTPEYTAEARALKIEGDVTLDVEFAATGEIRVHGVVRGLGHGLDDMAVRAVQGMRFKPARRNGEAVSVRAPVTIVFRLA